MLRFIIKRKLRDSISGLETESFETIDAECEDLERTLLGGGSSEFSYDHRSLSGVEVFPYWKVSDRIAQLEAERDALLNGPEA